MRIQALILRIIRQFLRDKRTMALLIIAPLLVLTLMYLVFNGDTYTPRIGVVDLPPAITERLEERDVETSSYESIAEADKALAEREIDAFITMNGMAPEIKLEGSDPAKNRAIMMIIGQVMQQSAASSAQGGMPGGSGAVMDGQDAASDGSGAADGQHATSGDSGAATDGQNVAAVGAAAAAMSPAYSYLHGGEEMTAFDSLGPVLIGVFAFFFVFLIAGVSFLKERTSGTLERLLATPLKRWEIVTGYIAGFGIFTGVQAVLIALFSIHVLGLMMAGSIWYVLLITLLLSVTALSFGTFLSAFANTEFQMIQFIPLVIVPQIFFSGLFNLESISPWLRWLSHLMPLKYGADALRNVMIRGEGWSGIALEMYVLIGLTLIFMTANVLALRKHRKI